MQPGNVGDAAGRVGDAAGRVGDAAGRVGDAAGRVGDAAGRVGDAAKVKECRRAGLVVGAVGLGFYAGIHGCCCRIDADDVQPHEPTFAAVSIKITEYADCCSGDSSGTVRSRWRW